jgi:hypothetical protein
LLMNGFRWVGDGATPSGDHATAMEEDPPRWHATLGEQVKQVRPGTLRQADGRNGSAERYESAQRLRPEDGVQALLRGHRLDVRWDGSSRLISSSSNLICTGMIDTVRE